MAPLKHFCLLCQSPLNVPPVRLSGRFPRLRAFFFACQRVDNDFVYTLKRIEQKLNPFY